MRLVKTRVSIVIIISLMIMETIYAQNTEQPDYLKKAKSLIEAKQFNEAYTYLSMFIPANQSDIETIWLFANVAHAIHKDNISEIFYEKALALIPDNKELKFEFARMLFQSERLKKAELMLQSMYELKDQKFEILYYLAYIDLWNGRFTSTREKIAELKLYFKESPLIDELETELNRITSFVIIADYNHLSDNQPLISNNFNLGLLKSFNALFNPQVNFSYKNYVPSAGISQLIIGNSFSFPAAKASISVNAGLFHNGYINSNHLIGQLSIKKRIGKVTEFELGYLRQPYLSTLKSIEYDLLNSNYYLDFEHGNTKTNLFHGTVSIIKWDDNNQVQSYSFWYLSKPFFKKYGFSIKAGAGIGYSDSKDIRYVPERTDVLSDTSVYSQVDGVYSPYYTPGHLTTFMGLIDIKYSPVNRLNFSLKGNAAIYGQADIPVIIKSYDNIGSPELILYTYKSNVHPFDATLNINYSINAKSAISIYGSYFDTYYYDNFKTGITFTKRF